jgi:hypothetical protein
VGAEQSVTCLFEAGRQRGEPTARVGDSDGDVGPIRLRDPDRLHHRAHTAGRNAHDRAQAPLVSVEERSRCGARERPFELVAAGLRDLERGVESVEALLVSIGAPRLRFLGLAVPETPPEPELKLYRLLARKHGAGAHSRYNALIRRLVSYERAAAAVGVAPHA